MQFLYFRLIQVGFCVLGISAVLTSQILKCKIYSTVRTSLFKEDPMDNKYMKSALKEAWKAYEKGETPVGAIVVKDGRIIARAHNLRETKKDSIAHAEILAIRKASAKLDAWRLLDCDLYVTLEPCTMCAGAIIQSRIRRVFYGADDPKAGAAGSVIDIFEKDFNHKVEVYKGIMEEECSEVLKNFFKELRNK